MKNFLRIVLWTLLIVCILIGVAAATGFALDKELVANASDLLLYKTSFSVLFGSFALCLLVALIRSYIPAKENAKKFKLWPLYLSICVIGVIAYSVLYSCTSAEFKAAISSTTNNAFSGSTATKHPTTAPTEAATTVPTEADTTAPTEVATTVPTEADTTAPTEVATTAPTAAPTVPATAAPTVPPTAASTTAPTEATVPPQNEIIYSTLTDTQFSLLTEALAKSFYSFTLDNSEYQTVAADSQVMTCLTEIYNYAYKNYFELLPEYRSAFAQRSDIVASIPSYSLLNSNFTIGYELDYSTREWNYFIRPYTLSPDDTVTYDGVIYIDAEGYLKKGVELFWEEDGAMVKVGKVIDIAYDTEIDGTVFGYAVNVEFYDDPYSSGWMDGAIMLTANKQFTGKPIYYVAALDPNRSIIKEEIDYNNSIVWHALTKTNLVPGIKVYCGITDTKSYTFTVLAVDAANDTIIVQYPSGSIEEKSYTAMLSLGSLYIK